MGFLNLFNKKSDNGAKLSVSLPVIDPAEAKEEIKSVETPVTASTNEEKPMTISYATGWPIDVVYGYLHKNYESKGFDDAMLKSDLAFCDLNMSIIKNKIQMVFREINLNYDVMKQDLQSLFIVWSKSLSVSNDVYIHYRIFNNNSRFNRFQPSSEYKNLSSLHLYLPLYIKLM